MVFRWQAQDYCSECQLCAWHYPGWLEIPFNQELFIFGGEC